MSPIPTEPTPNEPSADDPRLAEAMEAYLAQLEAGIRPDRVRFISRYPELGETLPTCLDGLEFLHCVAPQLEPATVALAAAGVTQVQPLATLGDFRIVREIGRGGMAVVYEAVQLSLGRTIALKVLPFASMLDERQLKRFQNEARAAASLEHRHIVPVFGFGTDRGVHYYAMRLINGQSLDHVISALRREREQSGISVRSERSVDDSNDLDWTRDMPPSAINGQLAQTDTIDDPRGSVTTRWSTGGPAFYRIVARLGVQAAEALSHAHSQGVLHRDIKPGNLLLDEHGSVWVADFGLARVGHDTGLTRSGDVIGTLRYMSPEQASSRSLPVDHRTDIYSLGATLYELATLRPLCPANDRELLIQQIGCAESPPPRQVNGTIPAELSTIINKCIQKDPMQRYANAQELADDLQRFLDDKPIHARAPSWIDSGSKWLRRNRVLAWTVAVAMMAVSIVLAISTARIARQKSEVTRQRDLAIRREIDLQQHLYASDMLIAADAWRIGAIPRMREVLDRHRPTSDESDVRGFVWNFLDDRARSNYRELTGHTGPIYHLAVSPDGQTFASVGLDRTIRIWELASGQLKKSLAGHSDETNSIAFTPDGKTIATAGDDRTVRVWDVASGEQRWQLDDFARPVIRVRFSPDGTQLAVTDANVDALELTTSFWNVATREKHQAWEGRLILDYCPADDVVATAAVDNIIRLQSRETGEVLASLSGHRQQVTVGVFRPDGSELVTGDKDGVAIVWDVRNQLEAKRLTGSGPWLRSLAFSPDGSLLSMGADDGVITIWHAPTYAILGTNYQDTGVWALGFSCDGKGLVSAGTDGILRLWNSSDLIGRKWLRLERPVTAVSLSFDRKWMATCSRYEKVELWKLPDAELVRHFKGGDAPTRCAFSPIESVLAIGGHLGEVSLVAAESGDKLSSWSAHDHEINSLMFSGDGRWLATSDGNTVVRVWNVSEGSLLGELPINRPGAWVSSMPGGKRWLVPDGTDLTIWDAHHGSTTKFPSGHASWIFAAASSSYGDAVVTSGGERAIKVWDAITLQPHMDLHGDLGIVNAMAFSPDATTLVSGTLTGETSLWDLRTGQRLLDLPGHSHKVHCAAFSSDGGLLVTAGETLDGHGEVWLTRAPGNRPTTDERDAISRTRTD